MTNVTRCFITELPLRFGMPFPHMLLAETAAMFAAGSALALVVSGPVVGKAEAKAKAAHPGRFALP